MRQTFKLAKQPSFWLVVGVLISAGVGFAQTKVDQGKPGTQGCWPVCTSGTTVVTVNFDGGFIGSTTTAPCSTIAENNTDAGTVALPVPATPLAGRIWIRICNSLLNANGSQCICSATTTPSFTAGSKGDPLAVSDCVLYNLGANDGGEPRCICNGAGIWLPSEECIAP